jgi:signal transduction histidine kinase
MKQSTIGAWPRAAWLLWLAAVVLSVAASAIAVLVVLSVGAGAAGLDVYTVVFLVLAPIYATVGVIILSRASGNHVGWVLLLIGALLSIQDFSGASGSYAATPAGGWVPSGVWMNWISTWAWVPVVVGALALLPLLFPNGRLPSRGWTPLVWVVCGATAASLGGYVFIPSGINTTPAYVNPVGLAALTPLTGLFHALYVLAVLVGVLGGAGSLLVRYRHGNSDERHQIKWFAGAFVLLAVMLAAYAASGALGIASPDWLIAVILCLGLTAVPLTVAVAVLRYRLYDIDVVLNRALVYGALALFITAVYVGIAVGIGALIGGGGKPNLGLSILATAIVAVGFQPVRERLQRVANRLVYGKRATPYEVLSQFSERVAESYAMDDVMPRMARVLAEGTGAQRADVWLRGGTTWREAAVWPMGASLRQAVPVNGDSLPLVDGSDRMVAVRHQGDLLGALSVTKRGGESLTPVEENLLTHLAGQAGLVVKNVGLTADLQARLEELRASRQRLVTAQDEERRRLERNLHDGAQQHLVALKVKLGLAEMLMGRDPDKAKVTLEQLKGDADEALQTLRDLARGIYPPLLAEKGLTAALESQARKATVPVTVNAEGLDRYPQEIEAAVYFCVLEALQNVQKYASASVVAVSLAHSNGKLDFSVSDDGCGFDTAANRRGSGLLNMEDRLDALGGHLTVRSLPGSGTTLYGDVPTNIGVLNPA